MNSAINDKFIQKLAALKAKAESTDFDHERAALLSKVRELLDRHNLDMTALEIDQNPMGEDENMLEWRAYAGWKAHLAGAVCRYFDCEMVYTEDGNAVAGNVIGRQGARETVKIMWPYILQDIKRKARAMPRVVPQRAERHIGNALTNRIYALIRTRQNSPQETSSDAGLIVVNENSAWVQTRHPNAKEANACPAAKYRDCIDAANAVNLCEQVNAAKPAALNIEATP